VAALRDGLERERAAAERRARDAAAERRLLARLEAIRGERGEHWNPKRADRAYGEAFRAFGLDVDKVAAGEAGAKLAGRPGTAEIAAALDEWCLLRRLDLAGDKEVRPWQRLAAVARAADPDPWRNGLRAAFGRPPVESAAVLKKLAADGKFLEQQPAASLVLLARMLAGVGEGERSAAVLRSAWRRFPGDFWVNYNLGVSSWSRYHFERPEEAVRFLTAAVAARPGSAPAHNGLGNVLYDQQKLDEAIVCYRRAIELDPKLAAAHSNLGNALDEQGKLDEAIAAHRQAIKLDPKDAMAHNNLGIALYNQGKQDKAITAFHQAIKLDPKLALAHNNLGGALSDQGKLDEAIACCRGAIKLDPKDAAAHNNLGNALSKQGKLDKAIGCYRQAIKLDRKFAKPHTNLGVVLRDQGKLDEAIAAHRQAIELDPKFALAHNNLGNALARQGRLDEAIACFRQAIMFDPKLAVAHISLARAERMAAVQSKLPAFLKGEYQPRSSAERFGLAELCEIKKLHHAGARLYAEAFTADPKLADDLKAIHRYNAACNAALVGCGQGKDADKLDGQARTRWRNQALAWLRADLALRTKQLAGGRPDDRQQVASTMQQWQGDADFVGVRGEDALAKLPASERAEWQQLWAAVQALLDKASANPPTRPGLDPKDAPNHNNLGLAFYKQRKLDEAIACFRQAIDLDPKFAPAHINLGNALKDQGKLDEAIDCYHQAIQLHPKYALAHYNLGNALSKQGKLDEAIACYRQAIKLDPKYAEAHCNLGNVLQRQGRFTESLASYQRGHALGSKRPGWPYPSPKWVRMAERLVTLEKQLPDVLSGKLKPAGTAEWIEYAALCIPTKRYAASARLYVEAFTADPKLPDDLATGQRYIAAILAALAGCGQGKDGDKLDDQARACWRNQALAWLRADLALRTKQLAGGRPNDRRQVASTMLHWQRNPDFVGVRGEDALAELPASERAGWQQLWAEVQAVLERASAKPPTRPGPAPRP
jgi:tetratricopeptide (TPR) repeat protein